MSSLDIYDDTENIISSDEYSDEEDDELMNAAISTHHNRKPENSHRYYNRPPERKIEKVKEQRLPFRRKLCSKYKSRSLKWLNGKTKREKSKQYLLCLKRRETSRMEYQNREKEPASAYDSKEQKKADNVSETIELDESDIEYSSPIKVKEEKKRINSIEEIKELVKDQKAKKPKDLVEKSQDLVQKQKEIAEKEKKIEEKQKEIAERIAELDKKQESIEKSFAVSKEPPKENVDKNTKKRPRSVSPVPHEEENKSKKQQPPERPTSRQLYRQINEMFSKYDEVVVNHVKSNSNTMDAIEENMTRLMQDIQTLNDIMQAKETEWNRLLNLKRVKEEILGRLARKKHVLNIQDRKFEENKYNLQTLKELELYLSESQPSISANIGLSTAHQIIESRASMKTEELEKERNNTNRLQNLLISNNILQRSEGNYEINASKNNLSPLHNTPFNDESPELQQYQYLEQKIKSKAGRQGPLVDVKSIVADFRQQNPVVFPRVGKRIKTNDASSYKMREISSPPNCADGNNVYMETYNGNGSNYSPTLEKLLSTSSRNHSITHAKHGAPTTQGFKFNTESQKSYYRLQSDDGCNEISITPVNCINRYPQRVQNSKTGLLRTALDVSSQHHNDYYDMPEYVKSHKAMRDGRNNDTQLCQECKMSEARFVCAGCGNQWYCSRECQVNAWDKHSDVCSE